MKNILNKELDLKREIILDHYENPKNKIKNIKKISKNYVTAHKDSPSCIDDITVYLKFNNSKIVDAKFSGIACAISTSSTDIVCELIKNKTIKEANNIIENYFNMIDNKQYDDKKIKELNIFNNVNKQINRIKCAKIGVEAIKTLLK